MQSGKNGDMNGDRKGPTPPLEERKVIITGTAEAQWKVRVDYSIFCILQKHGLLKIKRFMIILHSSCLKGQFKGKGQV